MSVCAIEAPLLAVPPETFVIVGAAQENVTPDAGVELNAIELAVPEQIV